MLSGGIGRPNRVISELQTNRLLFALGGKAKFMGIAVDKSRARPSASAGTHQSYAADPALRERDDRIEALKDLVDHLAHDFNNMLVPLLGYVTLIKEELNPDSSSMKYASKIEHSAKNTEGLIEKTLTAVRPQRCFNPTAGDLAQVLEAVLGKWQATLPRTSQIRVQTSFVPCPLVFDHALISVLFEQILSNARYAMALGGLLEVSLRPKTLSSQRSLELNVCPSTYELVLSDNGFGMSPDILRRVFEPFFTTRPRGLALGLGLTTVHSITQLHGGQVIIESTEEVGTTISIWFPREQAPSVTARSPAPATRQRSGDKRGSKVLVIDDDPVVREVLKACLQRLPVEVAVAQDGAEGLKTFQRNPSQFGLIVCDICMPKIDGLEFYENVHKLDPHVPIIWMSGDPETASEDALARFGPKHPLLLRKPLSLNAFTETIRKYVSYTISNPSPSRNPCN